MNPFLIIQHDSHIAAYYEELLFAQYMEVQRKEEEKLNRSCA